MRVDSDGGWFTDSEAQFGKQIKLSRSGYSLLTATDLEMSNVVGRVNHFDSFIQVISPDNPDYYWGNYLLLFEPPDVDDLPIYIDQFHDLFQEFPEVKHVLLRWDGPEVSAAVLQRARELQLVPDHGFEMIAGRLLDPEPGDLEIRPIDFSNEFESITALNILCDPKEASGSAGYRLFKEGLRRSWRVLAGEEKMSWWGAYIGDQLVGQCGMVLCSDRMGRYQSIETHPEYRRRGICSALVATVGRHAIEPAGCSTVLLGADPKGPAIGLYQRLGFVIEDTQWGLLSGGESDAMGTEEA